jgi:2-polyprenyl-3-methyl-5-hydroxy-6-metoxy-1,4-benzoquinol methylase
VTAESPDALVGEMQTYYARRAPMYDASMGYDDARRVALLDDVVASLRRQLRGRSVLEIACGPGFWTGLMSDVVRSVAATDCNESTLNEARRKPLDWSKVTLRIADAYELAHVPGDFDGAFAVDWLAHVPRSRLDDFLMRLHARLTPGSRVVFCDQSARPESMTGTYDADGNHLQERILPDGSRYRVIKNFFSDDELRARFGRYTSSLDIERYARCRRVVVAYTLPG